MSGAEERSGREREREVEEALRALPDPVADPAFEERLRRRFVAGDFAAPAPAPRRRRLVLAAAAVLLITLGLFARFTNRSPWQSLPGDPARAVRVAVDGREFVDLDRAVRALEADAVVTTDPSTEWTLRSGDLLVVLTPGSELRWPGTPGRLWSRDLDFELVRGELRLCTGPRFQGSTLRVHTEEAEALVVGTTLAVVRDDQGTCLCVLEGRVRLTPTTGEAKEVEAGHRRVVHRVGPIHEEELGSSERRKLQMLDDRGVELMEGDGER